MQNVSFFSIILKTSQRLSMSLFFLLHFPTDFSHLYIYMKQGTGLKTSSELFKVEKMASCPVYGRSIFLAFLRYYFFGKIKNLEHLAKIISNSGRNNLLHMQVTLPIFFFRYMYFDLTHHLFFNLLLIQLNQLIRKVTTEKESICYINNRKDRLEEESIDID